MLRFQEELSSTENKVAFSRQAFNDAVLGYNNACETFPSNIVANTFNFRPGEFLEMDSPQKRDAPVVSF
jgi:LemA protein